MDIYALFCITTASIVGFGFLRNRLRNSRSHFSFKEQAIALETAQELRASDTLKDEAPCPVIGQLPYDASVLFLEKTTKATWCYNHQLLADGFRILGEAKNSKECYTLIFANLSLYQKVVTLDYRDNEKKEGQQFGVVLSMIDVPFESVTLQINGSEAHHSFFKKENNRYVIICNEGSVAFSLLLVIQNYSLDKTKITKSTKFQPIVIPPFTNLMIHYFEAEQAEDSSSNYIALAKQLSSVNY